MYKVTIRKEQPWPPPRPPRVAVTSAGSTGSATYRKALGILDSESADHVPSLDRKKLPADHAKTIRNTTSEAVAGILKLAQGF